MLVCITWPTIWAAVLSVVRVDFRAWDQVRRPNHSATLSGGRDTTPLSLHTKYRSVFSARSRPPRSVFAFSFSSPCPPSSFKLKTAGRLHARLALPCGIVRTKMATALQLGVRRFVGRLNLRCVAALHHSVRGYSAAPDKLTHTGQVKIPSFVANTVKSWFKAFYCRWPLG